MVRFILRRVLWSVLVLFLVTAITFGMMQLLPGGPYSMGRVEGGFRAQVPPQVRANMIAKFGLDKPAWRQYLNYMGQLICHLDFGPSMWRFDRTVNDIIFGRLYLVNVLRERLLDTFGKEARSMTFAESPTIFDSSTLVVKTNGEVIGYISITWRDRFRAIWRFLITAPVMVSAQVGIASAILAFIVGIPLGVVSAVKQNTWIDYLAMFFSMLGISIPSFVLGIVLILVFALWLEWLPTYGWGHDWKQVILPIITLSAGGWPLIARLTRASMLEVIHADYIRTARAKGLTEQIVIVRHALKNALIPVITVLGPIVANWLTGSFLVEWVFSIGGIGKLLVNAVAARDYPLTMGIILIYATVLVLFNLLVDVVYGIVDPRIQLA